MEEELLRALKARLLREIESQPAAPSFNIYAGGGGVPSGIQEYMSAGGSKSPANMAAAEQAGMTPEELEYMVNISRRDVEAVVGQDEEGNPIRKKIGWDKRVHRFAGPKGEMNPEEYMAAYEDQGPGPDDMEPMAQSGSSQGLGSLLSDEVSPLMGDDQAMKPKRKRPKKTSLFEEEGL
jgi:hypothetical protein